MAGTTPQPVSGSSPRFEVITVEENGTTRVERLRAWQLSRSFPLFRATQFVRSGSSAMPLSVLDGLVFPPLLLAFPFGTLILGLVMLLRGGLASPRVRPPYTSDQ